MNGNVYLVNKDYKITTLDGCQSLAYRDGFENR